MINFKGIVFSKNKYNSFVTIRQKMGYRGLILQRRVCHQKLKFPQITIKDELNILKQLMPNEPQHSLILGSIINPNSKHGYGDIFLKEFFNIVVNDENYVYGNNERWIVTIEKNRFDIGIRNKNNTKIIIIENKSNWAIDQKNQLYRYWFDGIYKPQYRLSKYNIPHMAKIIYLSPSFEKQYDIQSISRPIKFDKNLPSTVPENIIKIVYYQEEISKWLDKCMELVKNTSSMYFYISNYKDFWR